MTDTTSPPRKSPTLNHCQVVYTSTTRNLFYLQIFLQHTTPPQTSLQQDCPELGRWHPDRPTELPPAVSMQPHQMLPPAATEWSPPVFLQDNADSSQWNPSVSLKPALYWAIHLVAEHTSDSSMNYALFLTDLWWDASFGLNLQQKHSREHDSKM